MTNIAKILSKDYWQNSISPLPNIEQLHINTEQIGIKYVGRDDLLLMIFEELFNVAGIFTTSKCPSAPVDHDKLILKHGKARALLVNSGNANAFTGKLGKESCDDLAQSLAQILKCKKQEIYLAATGVIGEPLDPKPIIDQLEDFTKRTQDLKVQDWHKATKAIMTTDSFAKFGFRTFEIRGKKYNINAIAKGAGMIAPDMATMLSFIVTDLPLEQGFLQEALEKSAQTSFNAISVDNDTSTSDTILLFAPQKPSSFPELAEPEKEIFYKNLKSLMLDLALQIVGDGEGATHLMSVQVIGAQSDKSAKIIAKSIANSPLVKTALAGCDANWGRVVAAIGKAGEMVDRDKIVIYFGDYMVTKDGKRADDYDEELLAQYMKNYQIDIKVDLAIGNGEALFWGCDLTQEYVVINGDYRS